MYYLKYIQSKYSLTPTYNIFFKKHSIEEISNKKALNKQNEHVNEYFHIYCEVVSSVR